MILGDMCQPSSMRFYKNDGAQNKTEILAFELSRTDCTYPMKTDTKKKPSITEGITHLHK